MNQSPQEKIESLSKLRKISVFIMLVGFLSLAWMYFYVHDFYLILIVWFIGVIVPNILNTVAGRKIRKYQQELGNSNV